VARKTRYTVDHRNVRANGVDLVAWIGTDSEDQTKNRSYEVYEITNWNTNSFLSSRKIRWYDKKPEL